MGSGVRWDVAGCPMRTFRWTPDFDPKVEAAVVAIWCRLPGLPVHLYHRDTLFTIASAIGKPLQVYVPTAHQMRLAYARVCVEIDLRHSNPSSIVLDLNGNSVPQKILYVNLLGDC